jgi:hypothetical protein
VERAFAHAVALEEALIDKRTDDGGRTVRDPCRCPLEPWRRAASIRARLYDRWVVVS